MIFGDLNGRTADKADFIVNDSADHLPAQISEFYITDCMKPRVSEDNISNTQGLLLLDTCIENSLRILNGRTMGDLSGRLTCYRPSGASVVDYALTQEDFLDEIQSFRVHDFLAHLSDHCCISSRILTHSPSHAIQSHLGNSMKHTLHKYAWSKQIEVKFKQILTSAEVVSQLNNLNQLDVNLYSPDDLLKQTNSIIYNIAKQKCPQATTA